MTTYEKYVDKLRTGCTVLLRVIPAIGQAPLVQKEEEIDARIKLIDAAIKSLQDAKRALIYFKNRMGRPNLL